MSTRIKPHQGAAVLPLCGFRRCCLYWIMATLKEKKYIMGVYLMSDFFYNGKEFIEKKSNYVNCIKNDFSEFTEIVFYKKPFLVTTGNYNLSDLEIEETTGELFVNQLNIDRSRKFKYNNGVLVPKDADTLIKIDDIQKSINNSRSRALDAIYGYCLSNKWKYFLTLTFDKKIINRESDDDVKEAWVLFRKKLQYIDENVKIFAIPERHKNGCLHFHVLLGDIDLSKYMVKAVNPNTNTFIKKNNRFVYNLSLFTFGFSTIVETDDNNLVISNYLTKYITKDFGTIGYNKKSYFCTRNLNFKNKELKYINDFDNSEISLMLNDKKLCKLYKETDKMIIYRFSYPFLED